MPTLANYKQLKGCGQFFVTWTCEGKRHERYYEGCRSMEDMYRRIRKEPGMEDILTPPEVPLAILGRHWDGARWVLD